MRMSCDISATTVTSVPAGSVASALANSSLTASATSMMLAPSSLLHGQSDRGSEIQPGSRRFVFESVLHSRGVSHVDGIAVSHLDDEVFDLFGLDHLGRKPHQILRTAHIDLATGNGQILLGDRLHEIHEAQLRTS